MRHMVLSGMGLVLLLCSACGGATSARLPDGSEGFSVNCNGEDSDWAECYNKASDACDGAYEVVAKDSSVVDDEPFRNLIVRCVPKN